MSDQARDPAAKLVDPHGRPVSTRRAPEQDTSCPACGRAKSARVASTGFGRTAPYPICPCGKEFTDEVFA